MAEYLLMRSINRYWKTRYGGASGMYGGYEGSGRLNRESSDEYYEKKPSLDSLIEDDPRAEQLLENYSHHNAIDYIEDAPGKDTTYNGLYAISLYHEHSDVRKRAALKLGSLNQNSFKKKED